VLAAARIDFYSGALSPRELERQLEREARRARRYARPLSLVILDIEATDPALVPRFVAALGRNVRECDLVGRLTKRRFVLVLVECPSREASRVMLRCREMLKQGFPGALRCDVGAVSYGGSSPTNAQQLLSLAEGHLTGARSGAMPETAQAQLA
jgi:GGDEF domain-containing protein